MKKLFFLLLCSLLTISSLHSTPLEQKTILIISSYNPDTRRMSDFISAFEQQIVMSEMPYEISIENLECRDISEAAAWMAKMDLLIHRYEPKNLCAIILLGQEAWASFISLGHIPENTQIFGSFVSDNGILLPQHFDPNDLHTWMPESVDMAQKINAISHNNAGGMLNHYNIRKNIDLILSLCSGVENIAFVSDNTYGGISLQALVRKEMTQYYPQLQLTLIDSRLGNETIQKKYAALPSKSAVLIGTWRVGRDGEYTMQRSLNELIKCNPRLPIFSVTGSSIGETAIGGYIPKYENGAKQIAEQILTFAKKGNNSVTHLHITEGEYSFDSRKLKEYKIPEYELPKESIVADTLATQLSKYSHYISLLLTALLLLIVFLIFIIGLLFRTRRLTRVLEFREGELVVAREKAEESDHLKSAFLANMSHEIRTPLNAIVGFSSLLGDEELTHEERAEYSNIVINNSEMLLTLLNDILDVSSLECGKTRFNYSSEDVVQICQHALLTTAHTRKAGVQGIFNPPCSSYMLVTDAHRLSQILINLLTNASKFTSTGSITLAFEVHEEEQLIYFSVTDTGEGIPKDKREIVFNRFEKLAGNQKNGTGLGLSICRQTTAIFGGRIWVDSDYDDGARFVFTHPLNKMITNQMSGENSQGGGNSTFTKPQSS
ncbi:MAG: ATP-binding protein [Alistipes sp.]